MIFKRRAQQLLLIKEMHLFVSCSYVAFRVSVSVSAAQRNVVIRLYVSPFTLSRFKTGALVQYLVLLVWINIAMLPCIWKRKYVQSGRPLDTKAGSDQRSPHHHSPLRHILLLFSDLHIWFSPKMFFFFPLSPSKHIDLNSKRSFQISFFRKMPHGPAHLSALI